MVTHFDDVWEVVIVGAGPAGCFLARELAKNGVKVLILEKERLPRIKTCGGGLNIRASSLIDFNFESIVEDTIQRIKVSYKGKPGNTKIFQLPLTYTVMRDKFDYMLAQKAVEAGAKLFDNTEVLKVATVSDKIIFQTPNHDYSAKLGVGADGSTSIVARSLGLMNNKALDMALESEILVEKQILSKWSHTIEVDFGGIPSGYTWIFPKADHLSIGIGGPLKQAKKLKPYLSYFIGQKNLGNYKILSMKSALLPLRNKGAAIVSDKVLVIGDAAGLIDALSGEGIYYCFRSAQLSLPYITSFLSGKTTSLQGYENAVDNELMPELQVARSLARLSGFAPKLSFYLLNNSDRVLRALWRIVRGEKTYSSIRDENWFIRMLLDLAKS